MIPTAAAAATPGFGLADPFDEKIRLAAAVHFKNHVRSCWTPSSSSDEPRIPDAEKNQIKALIVYPMLKALSIVSSHDFPLAWPGPPSSLSSSPTSAPPPTTPPSTASSAPPIPSSTPSTSPPSASTSSTASTASRPSPLPEVFVKAAQFISANATASSPDVPCHFFKCQRLCCRIFHSLNYIEFPEFFDDLMREWMTEFRSYLTTTNSPAVETEGTIDALRAAIRENLQLKMNKNEEEFKDSLKDFASAVWNLLTASSASASRDDRQHQHPPFPL